MLWPNCPYFVSVRKGLHSFPTLSAGSSETKLFSSGYLVKCNLCCPQACSAGCLLCYCKLQLWIGNLGSLLMNGLLGRINRHTYCFSYPGWSLCNIQILFSLFFSVLKVLLWLVFLFFTFISFGRLLRDLACFSHSCTSFLILRYTAGGRPRSNKSVLIILLTLLIDIWFNNVAYLGFGQTRNMIKC